MRTQSSISGSARSMTKSLIVVRSLTSFRPNSLLKTSSSWGASVGRGAPRGGGCRAHESLLAGHLPARADDVEREDPATRSGRSPVSPSMASIDLRWSFMDMPTPRCRSVIPVHPNAPAVRRQGLSIRTDGFVARASQSPVKARRPSPGRPSPVVSLDALLDQPFEGVIAAVVAVARGACGTWLRPCRSMPDSHLDR